VVTPRSGQQTIVTSPPEDKLPMVEELAEPTAPATTATEPTTQAAVPQQDTFIVQVGSFRKLSDADGFRANLALLGIESKVQTVTIDDKDTWHRVQVGPVVGRDQADSLQRRLRENNIDSLLLRAKHS
jgi:cell division protein FtsN